MKTEEIIKIIKDRYITAHCNPDFEGDKFKFIFQSLESSQSAPGEPNIELQELRDSNTMLRNQVQELLEKFKEEPDKECVQCDNVKETHSICGECLNKLLDENKHSKETKPDTSQVEGMTAEEFVNKKLGDKNYTHSPYTMYRKEITEWLIKYASQTKQVERREELNGFIKEIKDEFKDQNWDYLDFIADRYLNLKQNKDK
jgi:hypothetical protein